MDLTASAKNASKRIGALLTALLVLASVGFYAWTHIATYPAFPQATADAEAAQTERGWYVFEPEAKPSAGFIFYPGGLVDPAAYAPLMRRLADAGVLAVIVPMPLNLAVFGQGRAADVVAAYPDIDTWVLGGHSLGGAMAAEYMKSEPAKIDGVAFLASYPSASTDLSALSATVVSIYGSEDGVAGDVFEESLSRLPQGASLEVIAGGNHAQFGDYGPQKGDGTATVSREEQQRLTAEAIVTLVSALEHPLVPRTDSGGRTPDVAVMALIDALERRDWKTAYSLYATPSVDFATAAREWTEADEHYAEFTVHETRVDDAANASVRVTYDATTTAPGGVTYPVGVGEPGEWWPVHRVDGFWKTGWMPRQ